MLSNSDRDLLVNTANDVKWLRENFTAQKIDIAENRTQLDSVKKKVYYLFGGIAAVEILAHLKEALKL